LTRNIADGYGLAVPRDGVRDRRHAAPSTITSALRTPWSTRSAAFCSNSGLATATPTPARDKIPSQCLLTNCPTLPISSPPSWALGLKKNFSDQITNPMLMILFEREIFSKNFPNRF